MSAFCRFQHAVTTPVTVKDVIGRTVHWCVFDGGTQLGGAMWFIQALFQVSILYALGGIYSAKAAAWCRYAAAAGTFPACFCGWAGAAGWPDGTCGGWALRPAATACSTWAWSCGARRGSIPTYQRGIFAAAFAVLLILGRLGSVGLAGNGYSSDFPAGCQPSGLGAGAGGRVPDRSPALCQAALAYLGRATMPV